MRYFTPKEVAANLLPLLVLTCADFIQCIGRSDVRTNSGDTNLTGL